MKAQRRRPTRARIAKGEGKLALIPAWVAHPFDGLVGAPFSLLGTIEREYAIHRHPLYAWLAFQHARASKAPLPQWVLAYFDCVALELWRLARHPPKAPAAAVLEALRFLHRRGRGNVFDIAAHGADMLLANEADYEDARGNKGAQVVAERHKVSASTVYRARAQRR